MFGVFNRDSKGRRLSVAESLKRRFTRVSSPSASQRKRSESGTRSPKAESSTNAAGVGFVPGSMDSIEEVGAMPVRRPPTLEESKRGPSEKINKMMKKVMDDEEENATVIRGAEFAAGKEDLDAPPVTYIWDSNKIESIVLFCAFVVCLCGIMFDSGRFQGEFAEYYKEQKDGLAMVV